MTPIQPVLLGRADAAVAASRKLLERGYFVAAIRPPTVPDGTSRLRVTLSAAHRDADVESLVASLAEIVSRRMSGATRSPHSGPPLLDRAAIRNHFDKASSSYDESAVLQQRVRQQMIDRLDWIAFNRKRVVDLGCGTGHAALALARRWPKARVIAVDFAPGMMRELARHDPETASSASAPMRDRFRCPERASISSSAT